MVLIKVLSYQKRTFLFFTKIFNLLVKISRSWVYLRRDASFFFRLLIKSVYFWSICITQPKSLMWETLQPKPILREPCVIWKMRVSGFLRGWLAYFKEDWKNFKFSYSYKMIHFLRYLFTFFGNGVRRPSFKC